MITSTAREETCQVRTKKNFTLIKSLAIMARINKLGITEEEITQYYDEIKVAGETERLVAVAKKLKFRTKLLRPAVEELHKVKWPAIVVTHEGYFVALRLSGENLLIVEPEQDRPEAIPIEEFSRTWKGEVILCKCPFSLESLSKTFNLMWFIPVILQYRRYFAEVLAASFFLQIFGLVTPLFTQVIIDKVIIHKGESTLDVLIIALFCIASFQMVMGILRTYLSAHTTNKIDVVLASKMFRQTVKLPLRYFENRKVGDLVMRLAGVNSVREFFTGSSLSIFLDALFSVVYLAVMAYYSVLLTAVVMAAIPFYLVQNILTTPAYRKRLEKSWAAGSESNSFLVESITGIQAVKALALEPQFNRRWEGLIDNYVRANFQSAVMNLAITNSGQLIQKISTLSILLVGGHLVMKGDITVGQLVAFQMLSNQVNTPLLRLVGMWQTVQKTVLAVDRLSDVINNPPEFIPNSQQPRPEQLLKGNLQFDNVSFRYFIDTDLVLDKLSFHIPAGSWVGIIGPSGSGKSTVAKLIQRLYVPENGQVLMDGMPLTELEPTWLRRQIGIVLQDSYLFSGSIRDNIAATRPSASMEEVIAAACAADAHDFILELPEGYDTNVGERGSFLSGGQRQRIAIAQTLFINPRVLILDEATSALDYEAERIVMGNIMGTKQGRTVIMIAHRLQTVQKCDFIIGMNQGKVVEVGDHETLMALKGLYYNLYKQQEE